MGEKAAGVDVEQAESTAVAVVGARSPRNAGVKMDEDARQQAGAGPQEAGQVDQEEKEQGAAGGGPPFEPPFAPLRPPFTFWLDALLLVALGGALGAFGYAYLEALTRGTDAWLQANGNAGFPSDPATLRFGAGRAWWVGLGAGAGLAVGAAKAALGLDHVPSFLDELRSMRSEPAQGVKTAVVALLGLLGGVPMGPEAGLGALAGAAGEAVVRARCWVARTPVRAFPTARRRLYIYSAMCSAFSAILPSPLAALLLVLELGRPAATAAPLAEVPYMLLITLLGAGATAAFIVYWAINGAAYLAPFTTLLSVLPFARYDQMFVVEGALFGVMGAALGMCYILIGGVVMAIVRRLKQGLDARLGCAARIVVLATAGGAVTGAMGWAMPLVPTDGSEQLATVLRRSGEIGSGVLAASCFAKAAAYHIASECGFVGGLFLPMLCMSACLGGVFINETGVNPVVAMSCSLVALAAALVPAPIMLSVLAVSLLQGGTQGLVPILATALTAHLLCMGLGLPQRLVAAGQVRAAKAAAAKHDG